MPRSPVAFSAAVEGPTDEAILRRIVTDLGATLGSVYGRAGKAMLDVLVERKLSFEPTDREFEQVGYDIESSVSGAGKLRFIDRTSSGVVRMNRIRHPTSGMLTWRRAEK